MHYPRKAFTLVELLTVIAIIGILAAILFPVVGTIREKASMANCSSTLRQLHTTAIMMTNENGGVLPMSRNNNDVGKEHWPVHLLEYLDYPTMDEMKEELACPAYEGNSNGTFWMLGYAYNETPAYMGDSSGVKNNAAKKRLAREFTYRLTEVTNPQNRVMFCDSKHWSIGENSDMEDHVDVERHGSGVANAVFFDGHVEQMTPEEVDLSISDPGVYAKQKKQLAGQS